MQYVYDKEARTLTLLSGSVVAAEPVAVPEDVRTIVFRMATDGRVQYTTYGMSWSSRQWAGPMSDIDTVAAPLTMLIRTDILREIVSLFVDMFNDIFNISFRRSGPDGRKFRRSPRRTMDTALSTLTDMMQQATHDSGHGHTTDEQQVQVTKIISALTRNITQDQLHRVLQNTGNSRPRVELGLDEDGEPGTSALTELSGIITRYTALDNTEQFTERFVTPSLPMMMLMSVFRYVMAVHSVPSQEALFHPHVYGAHILLCNIRDVLTDRLGYVLFQGGVNPHAKEILRTLRTKFGLRTTKGTREDLATLTPTTQQRMYEYVEQCLPGIMVMPYALYYHMAPKERFCLMYDDFRRRCIDANMPPDAMGTAEDMWNNVMMKLKPDSGIYSPSDCIALLPTVVDMHKLAEYVQSANQIA